MNVGQLKKFLDGLPEGLPVLVPADDHSYRRIGVRTESAEVDGGHYSEPQDYDDPSLVRVVVIT